MSGTRPPGLYSLSCYVIRCLLAILISRLLWSTAAQGPAIKLVNGSTPYEGRVEILLNGTYGTVCSDGFDVAEARVVCRMLGLPDTGAQALLNATFGPGTGPVWLTQLRCWGYESSLANCMAPFSSDSGCTHARDAGVRCVVPSPSPPPPPKPPYPPAPPPRPAVAPTICRIVMVPIVVGRYLMPHASTWSGVIAAPSQNNADWGIDISNQPYLIIRDSLLQDLPLSEAALLFTANVSTVSGASEIRGTRGGPGWSCMMLLYATRVPDRSLTLDMANVSMVDNAVTRVGFFATLGPTRENIGRFVGMGCLVLASGCPECSWDKAAVWGTYDSSGSAISISMRDVVFANNTGGMGVGLSNMDLPMASSFVNNTAVKWQGGAIYANRSIGRLELRSSVFEGNTASWGGGGVAVSEAGIGTLLLLEGSRMVHNSALLRGGAVSSAVDIANVTLDGGSWVEGNRAGQQGGALHAERGLGRLLLRGASRIANNSAAEGGGCVAVPSGSVTSVVLESGSALRGCVTQSGDGGALLAATGLRELLLSGGSEVTGNIAQDGNGGAVAVRKGDLSRISVTSGSRICSNSASGNGGALWLGAGSMANAAFAGRGTAVCNNTAGVNGGGIAVTSTGTSGGALSALMLTDGAELSGNTAQSGSGGGAWAAGGSVAVMLDGDGTAVRGNTASVSGGGLWFGGSISSVACRNASHISANTAFGGAGGALYVTGMLGSFVLDSRAALQDNAVLASDGGALWVGGAINAVDLGGSCSVSGNRALGSGAMLYAPEGVKSVRISGGCRLRNNVAGLNGGVMELRQLPALLAVEGGAIVVNNTARRGDGGAFRLRADGSRPPVNMTLRLSDCTLDSNNAGLSGGAVFLAADEASGVGDSTGSSSAAASSGASSSASGSSGSSNATAPVGANKLQADSSDTASSGAVAVWTVLMRNTSLARNTAGWAGGVIMAAAGRRTALAVRLSGSNVVGNRAGDGTSLVESVWRDGGALAFTGTTAAGGAWLEVGGYGSGSNGSAVDVDAVWGAAAATAAVVPGSCSVLLEDSAFRNSYSGGSGGAVLLSSCQALLWRCSFSGNQALQAAVASSGAWTAGTPGEPLSPSPAASLALGAVNDSGGVLELESCRLQLNTARSGAGGAVYVAAEAPLRLLHCQITQNRAAGQGGGVAVMPAAADTGSSDGYGSISGGGSMAVRLANNSAGLYGGGLASQPLAQLQQNVDTGSSSCSMGPLEMVSCDLQSNAADASGGGAYVQLLEACTSGVRMQDVVFAGNVAGQLGGGAAVVSAGAGSSATMNCAMEQQPRGQLERDGDGQDASSTPTDGGSSDSGAAPAAAAAAGVVIHGGAFSSNQADTSGGGLYLATACSLWMRGTVLEGNFAQQTGGALAQALPATAGSTRAFAAVAAATAFAMGAGGSDAIGASPRIAAAGSLVLEAVAVTGNVVRGSGGGVHVATLSGVRVINSTFTQNSADQQGGAFAAVQPVLGAPATAAPAGAEGAAGMEFRSSRFHGNRAEGGSGGAIYSSQSTSGDVHLHGSTLTSNTAGHSGGAVAVVPATYAASRGGQQGIVLVAGCDLSANTATRGFGGAIFVAAGIAASIRGSNVTSNVAGQDGAGMAVVLTAGTVGETGLQPGMSALPAAAPLDVWQCRFESNAAAGSGGGLAWAAPGRMSVTDSVFVLNSGMEGSGGGVAAFPPDYYIRSYLLTDAAASGVAAGVGGAPAVIEVQRCRFAMNRAAALGGGLHVTLSTLSSGSTSDAVSSNGSSGGVLTAADVRDSTFEGNAAGTGGGGLSVLCPQELCASSYARRRRRRRLHSDGSAADPTAGLAQVQLWSVAFLSNNVTGTIVATSSGGAAAAPAASASTVGASIAVALQGGIAAAGGGAAIDGSLRAALHNVTLSDNSVVLPAGVASVAAGGSSTAGTSALGASGPGGGGGLYVGRGSAVALYSSTFSNNSVLGSSSVSWMSGSGGGGGILATNCSVLLLASTVVTGGTSRGAAGGGILAAGCCAVVAAGGRVWQSTAATGGGMFITGHASADATSYTCGGWHASNARGTLALLHGVTLSRNTAAAGGTGIMGSTDSSGASASSSTASYEGYGGGLMVEGVKLQVQVELVNGLGLRVPEDDAWTVTAQLSIEPVSNATTAKGAPAGSSASVLLSPLSDAPATGAGADAAAAADTSSLLVLGGGEGSAPAVLESRTLEVAVRGGMAEWDQVLASGWPGEYELVVAAVAVSGIGVQVAPLRQPVLLLPCGLGGAVIVPQPGYWHSAANSTAVHRCPKAQACRWPDSSTHAPSTSISFGSFLHINMGSSATTATQQVFGANLNASSSAAGAFLAAATDRRSRVLLQCQQQWYASRPVGGPALAALEAAAVAVTRAAAAGINGSTSNGSSGLADLASSACFLWGLSEADARSYMQLQCAPGYTGPLCGACQPGYFLTSDLSCAQCLSVSATAVLLTLGMLANAALILYTAITNLSDGGTYAAQHPDKVTAADVLKVAIVHMQYFIIISRLNIDWPDVILRFQGTLAAVTGAQGKFLSSPSCLNPDAGPHEQARAYLLSSLTTPAVVITLVSVSWICSSSMHYQRQAPVTDAKLLLALAAQKLAAATTSDMPTAFALSPAAARTNPASTSGLASAASVRKRLALLGSRISLPQPPPSVAAAAALIRESAATRASSSGRAPELGSAGAGPQPFRMQLAYTLSSRLGTAASAAATSQRMDPQPPTAKLKPALADTLSASGSLLLPRMSLANAASASEVVDFADTLEASGDNDTGIDLAVPVITLAGEAADDGTRRGYQLGPEPAALLVAAASVGLRAVAMPPGAYWNAGSQHAASNDPAAAFGGPMSAGGKDTEAFGGDRVPSFEDALPYPDVISPGDVYLIRKGATEAIVAAGMLPGADSGGIEGKDGTVGAAVRNLARSVTLEGMAAAATLGAVDVAIGLPSQLRTLVVTALTVLYAGWSQAALSIFACRTIDSAGGSGPFPELQQATWPYGYWMRDMSQQCYAGPHAAVYVPIGIAAVLLVCVAPPLASFAMLWRVRHTLDEPETQAIYGFLYLRYKRRFFYWDPVVQLQTLSLVAVDVFGRGLPVLQQSLLLLLGFNIIAAINMTAAPVRCRLLLVLEFLSLGVLSSTVTLGLFFIEPSQSPTGADGAAIGVTILLLNSALLFTMLLMLLSNYRQAVVDRCRVWWLGLQRALHLVSADARAQRKHMLQQRQLGRSGNGSGTSGSLGKLGQPLGAAAGRAGPGIPSVEEGGFYSANSLIVGDRHSAEMAQTSSCSTAAAFAQWPQAVPLTQQLLAAALRSSRRGDALSVTAGAREPAVVDFRTDAVE
ncbi:hypothetical protein HXX76_000869 [Chlamydomonas incerta]|uniref:SRCR domain-containing protein n=1 Tax=Chlamydomonas incerta TaxID=51695 RepID=A0A835WFS5_CHLIN|nr:hypothetical protein HXX76_000869 [Chlamydomonas incerta]|eukprot:KAG2446280.1 hypothetical protein HXX76_000869 [Chlamydomonas incerta]